MDIVDSKVSNNMGYAYLVLNKVSQQASDIATKSEKKRFSCFVLKGNERHQAIKIKYQQ
jgi:serine protease inhibitor ecotin